MRELKFRAYEKTRKVMDYTDKDLRVDFSDGSEPYVCNSKFDFEDYVLMQFTGLKDCKGKDIYEGDIIKYIPWNYPKTWDKLWQVKNDGCNFYLEFETPSPKDPAFKDSGITEILMVNKSCEVIGNIYENLELLEIK